MRVVKFCVGAFLLVAVFRETTGRYKSNPFLSQVVPPVSNVVNPVPGTPVLHPGVHPQNSQIGAPAYNNSYQPGTIAINIPSLNPQNPFFNSQQPPVGVVQPPPPHAQPPLVPVNPQNPFFYPQQPPVEATQSPLPHAQPPVLTVNQQNPFLYPQQSPAGITQSPLPHAQPPVLTVNPQNPFLYPQQPPAGVTQSPLPHAQPTVVPVNPQNPFLYPQQPPAEVTQSPLPHTQPPVVPVNPHNPFLCPQHPSGGVTQPLLPPSQPPVAPINPQNPFLNSQQPLVGVTQPPVNTPRSPTQPQPVDDLRKRCLRPRGQFPSDTCNTLVNCWDDLAVEQFCPVGLVFNPAGFCDHAYNVDCQGKPYAAITAPVGSTAGITALPQTFSTISPDVLPSTSLPPSYLPPGSVPVDQNLKKKCLGPRGLFASDYCSRYVNCWDGNVVEQDCPPGLLFSSKGYCDFSYNVNCYNRILFEINIAPRKPINKASPVPQPPAASTPPTNIPPDNLNPKPPQNGVAPTHPTYRPPLNGTTEGASTPPTYAPLGDLTDQRLRKKCLGEQGLFPSYYCHKFVNCWDKFVVEQECPAGLFFSDKGYCDYSYNVNCYNRTVITISVPQPPASPAPPTNLPPDLKPKPPQPEVVAPPTYRPPLDGLLTLPTQTKKPSPPETTTSPSYVPSGVVPDNKLKKKCLQLRGQFPSDICNKYVNCWDGYVVEQDCPPGLHFSEKGYCDYPYNVNCNNRTIITIPLSQPTPPPFNGQTIVEADKQTLPPYQPVHEVVTQAPQQPAAPSIEPVDPAVRRKCLGLRGQFPSESCHKYIDCWDNVAVEHDCPPGLLFSEKGYCDFHYNVNCSNRSVIKTTTGPLCPTPSGTFRDKSNCSRYFTCIENAVAVKYECPAGLNFNDVIGVCDYAYRVDCNREPFVYEPLKNINFLQNVPASVLDATAQCRPGRVLRLNPECTSAALCRNTVTEVVHCPAGLAYDAPSDRCVPPQLAQCQDS